MRREGGKTPKIAGFRDRPQPQAKFKTSYAAQ
jgi:hypothetical protein